MNQRAVSQLAFGRLDRPGELPALRDADHPVIACDPNLRQGVHDGADTERIEADRAQLAALVDTLGQHRDLGDVVAQVSNDPRSPAVSKSRSTEASLLRRSSTEP